MSARPPNQKRAATMAAEGRSTERRSAAPCPTGGARRYQGEGCTLPALREPIGHGFSPRRIRQQEHRGHAPFLHGGDGLHAREGRGGRVARRRLGQALLLRHRRRDPDRVLGDPRRRRRRRTCEDRHLRRHGPGASLQPPRVRRPDARRPRRQARPLAGEWLRRCRDRPRVLRVDLHRRPERDHGGVLLHDPSLRRRRPRRWRRSG